MPVPPTAIQRAGRLYGPAVLVTLGLLGLLEIASRENYLPIFIPAPSLVAAQVIRQPGLLVTNVAATSVTALCGFCLAAFVAGVAALGAVIFRRCAAPVYNTGLILQSIPIIATAPLLAVCLGGGSTLQIGIAALSSQFPILVGTMQGLRAADESQRELMHILSASPAQTLRYVLVPMAAPYIFAGLKVAAPSAVLGAITAEWTGADRGIGTVMLYALFSYDIVKVWLTVVATSVLAALGYGVWAAVESRVIYWDQPAQLPD